MFSTDVFRNARRGACRHHVLKIVSISQRISRTVFRRSTPQGAPPPSAPPKFSYSSADDFDSDVLAKAPGLELQDEELDNVFNYPRNLLDVYDMGDKIGSGSFGIVYVVTHKKTGFKYACKVIPKKPRTRNCTPGYLLKLQNEVDCMKQLGASLNAVCLHDVFEDHTSLFMVMELCEGGALLDYLAAKKDLTESTIARVMRACLQFLAQCHGKGVIYRDVKAGNFLFLNKGENSPLKATDFGLAIRHLDSDEPLISRAGTPAYMAPEVILQEYNSKCDVWSAGILAFQLLTGRFPFHEDIAKVKLPEVFRATLTEQLDFSAAWVRDAMSDEALDFLKTLLVRDPDARPTALEALKHPWLNAEGRGQGAQAPAEKPLRDTTVQRLQRFATLGHMKQVILMLVMQEVLTAHGGPGAAALRQDPMASESLAMLEKSRELFLEMDADQSGEITYEELVAALSKQGVKLEPTEVLNLFQRLDINSDGRLQWSEFASCFLDWDKLMLNQAWDAWVDKALDTLDSDKSGCIELTEIEALLENQSDGRLRLQEAKRMLREADRDRDGRISRQEFRQLLKMETSPDTLEAYDDRRS